MKKSLVSIFVIVFSLIGFVLAECNLEVSMVNQDPYPAVPGDYVKLLFQVSGVGGTDCGEVSLELLESYPLRFDPGFNPIQTFQAGTFARGYSSNWVVPYNVRIDSSALDGDTEIEVLYSTKGSDSFKISENFNLSVEEVKADFGVFVRSYDYSTKKLVLEILNTAKNDVEAVVIAVPRQDIIKIQGTNKNIVGDLDSNDYTSTDFTAIPFDGTFFVDIEYSDETGERRFIQKEVSFESDYFEHTIPSEVGAYKTWIFIALILIAFVVWRVLKKRKKKLIR
jgi:hypothetical protein